MGQVTISFLGVCTIFRDLPSLQPPPGLPPDTPIPRNRVVLARTTKAFLDDHPGIFPHIARLQLVAENVSFDPPEGPPHKDPNAPYTYELKGVQLRIRNAAGGSSTLTGNLDCLPGLQDHLIGQSLGGPAPWVYLADPERVRAWFDLTNGDAAAWLMRTEQKDCDLKTQVPGITVVTITTENDDPLVLEYVPFDGGPTILITLSGESPNVNVMNFAEGKAFVDDNQDYLLNYQLANQVPPDNSVSIPQTNVCMHLSPLTYEVEHPHRCGDAGPGCSTTPFP